MQMLPAQRAGSDSTTAIRGLDEAALRAVVNPMERARQAALLLTHLQTQLDVVLDVRRDAVRELVMTAGVARSLVARALGLTPARISQLIKTRSSVDDDVDTATAGAVR